MPVGLRTCPVVAFKEPRAVHSGTVTPGGGGSGRGPQVTFPGRCVCLSFPPAGRAGSSCSQGSS